MNNIIQFDIGCLRCIHLTKIAKSTYICDERVHMDGSDVIPIRDGKRTEDWNTCNHEDYIRYNKINNNKCCNSDYIIRV